MQAIRQTFSNPPLRRLLLAQVPADFADWLDYVAIAAILAYSWRVEPVVFAFLAVALGLPYLLVGPFAGVLVDRSGIKMVLIASNLERAAATLCLAFAPTWQILLLVVFARNSVDAFFTPAKQAAIQALATPEQRQPANGISHAINQASKLAAPALGGAMLIALLPQQVFWVNACVSLLAAIILIGLPSIIRPKAEDKGDAPGIFGEILGSLHEVLTNRRLTSALAMMAAGFFAMFLYDTLIAPMTRDLGFDETVLGLALAAVGAGGVAGALWLGSGGNSARPFVWVAAGSAVSGITVTLLFVVEQTGTVLPVWLFLLPFAIVGFASAMIVVPIRTIVQDETPPARIARVTALGEAANTVAMLGAPFIGAALASRYATGAAFLAGGALLVLLALVALVVQAATRPSGAGPGGSDPR